MTTHPPMSVPEFFEHAGLRPTSGWKLINAGRIPVIRLPGVRRVLVSHETLERFLVGDFSDGAPKNDRAA